MSKSEPPTGCLEVQNLGTKDEVPRFCPLYITDEMRAAKALGWKPEVGESVVFTSMPISLIAAVITAALPPIRGGREKRYACRVPGDDRAHVLEERRIYPLLEAG